MARPKSKSSEKTRSGGGLPRMLRAFAVSAGISLLLAASAAGWFFYQAEQPVYESDKPLDLVINYGTPARGIVALLQANRLEVNEHLFLGYAAFLGVERQLMAGVYQIEPGISQKTLIERLSRRDPSSTEFRILEGWTVEQTLEALSRQSEIRFDIAAQALAPSAVANTIGVEAGHPEGWLYPDLYIVPKGSSALELLRRSASIQRQVIASEWDKRARDLPYRTPYEALIVASIVEKETQYPGDREKVAAVFANRIRLGMPLQADPTVIYGLGKEFAGDITRKHLKKDTPYNTYTRKTLPPTPISNPGPRAIRAVMNPAESKALYFVARGDGSSEFSETLKDHNQAVDRFIRRVASAKDTK
ncbi:MAG: endolytic transglycosylase MltG [Betaproteobacteria bacterium]|nr:endolytic transglycosylase MltG [Betaproteobacteria bacterium]